MGIGVEEGGAARVGEGEGMSAALRVLRRVVFLLRYKGMLGIAKLSQLPDQAVFQWQTVVVLINAIVALQVALLHIVDVKEKCQWQEGDWEVVVLRSATLLRL